MTTMLATAEIEERFGTTTEDAVVTDRTAGQSDRIAELARELTRHLEAASNEIGTLNDETRFLSINAQIEAARAGGRVGAAFGVVAHAIQELSAKTASVAKTLTNRTSTALEELQRISANIAEEVRAVRLMDLAQHAMDLIDRNLYERTCDVRWWATDESVVAALTSMSDVDGQRAARRMGIILDSYTVYYDLVLVDTRGRIIANGRPERYASRGLSASQSLWFRSAMAKSDGTEFGFESAHVCPLAGNQRVLAYSCAVREGGHVRGRPLGVLAALFNWDALGQQLVENTPLSPEDAARSRVVICDDSGHMLADSQHSQLKESLVIDNRAKLFSQARGYQFSQSSDHRVCVAHAASQGFETYSTGWHCVVVQNIESPENDVAGF